MINEDDKGVLLELLLTESEKFGLKHDQIFNVERLIYGDYYNGIDGESRPYLQIAEIAGLLTKIAEYLEDFNSGSKQAM